MEAWVSEAALMVKSKVWTIQRVTNSKRCVWQLYASRMHPYFWKTGKIKVSLFTNGRKKKRKRERKRTGLLCRLWSRIIILKTQFLLEWSFWSCPPPLFACHERQTRWDGGRRSSLCGCKLLGLCPDPLLIVHPVLTETRRRQGEVFTRDAATRAGVRVRYLRTLT